MRRETLRDLSRTRIGDTKKWSWWQKLVWWNEMLIPCCKLSCSCRNSSICHQLPLKSLYFSIRLCEGWLWLFLRRRSKLNNSSRKWQSPAKNWIVEQLNRIIILSLSIELIECWVLIICCDTWIICLFISLLVPLRPLVGLRPPSKIPSFSHSVSLCLILSKTQHLVAFSLLMLVPGNAWPVPQPTGAQGRMRVPREEWPVTCATIGMHWCVLNRKESLLPRSKQSQLKRNFLSGWEEKRSEISVEHELETQKNDPDDKNWCGGTKCWSLVVNCHVLVEILRFVINCLWNLSISLFDCAKVDFDCSCVVVQNWTILLENDNLLLRIE